MKIAELFFGKPEEINGGDRCPTYMYRWVCFSCRWFKVYLHRFVGNDWSRDLHDHPKRFWSIGLCGSYNEESETGFKVYKAPWIRTFPAEHRHRLSLLTRDCWTIVIVGRPVRDWGFWSSGTWIQWEEYVFGSKRHLADKARDC